MRTRLTLPAICLSALVAGCASDYGGSISGDSNSLSPEERRLQQVETRVAELSRRLDSVNLAGMDQENLRLRDDIRTLRGEMERMRYDFDQQNRRAQAQYGELDKRLQRFENPLGVNAPPPPGGSIVSPSGTLSQPQQYSSPQYSTPSSSYGAPPASQPPQQYQGQQGQGLSQPYAIAPSSPQPSSASSYPPPAQPTPQAPPPPSGPTVSQGANGAPPVVNISSGSGASPEEEGAYLAAFDQLKNGKYDAAVTGFRSMLERWPQGRYADNAWYWMGQANEIKSDYKSALSAYQSLLQRFPTSPKAPEAMLHMGLAQLKLKQEAEGKATLQRVIQAYPSSSAAKLAQQRLEPPKSGR